MSKFIEKKKARAAQIKGELESLRTLMDIAPQDKLEEHYQRAMELNAELRSINVDLADLMSEPMYDTDPDGRTAAINAYERALEQEKGVPAIIRSQVASQQPGARTRAKNPAKVVFRSGEMMAAELETDGIDADKCLRAAITGNYSELNDAEKRSVTPTSGGAMLAPEVSSIVIDNLRQTDWVSVIEPTFVNMTTGEVKIPRIVSLPTAVMHTPGNPETPTDPAIDAATLSAKTLMCTVSVANELLSDAATSQGVILQAATDAISNLLLQQILYGNGTPPEMKGLCTYDAETFAAAESAPVCFDLFSLVTKAKTAIIKKNGTATAMLYDPDLEERLNARDAEGNIIQPTRAFAELYDAGKVLAHPSVEPGDMLVLQGDALFIGLRQSMEIKIDPYTSAASNCTNFTLVMRGDCFANTAKMVYYSDIPA